MWPLDTQHRCRQIQPFKQHYTQKEHTYITSSSEPVLTLIRAGGYGQHRHRNEPAQYHRHLYSRAIIGWASYITSCRMARA